MEVKINKDILGYKESVLMGLTLRQSVCSILSIGTATAVYFLCEDHMALQFTQWASIVGAIPFGFIGFFNYNGLTAEQFLVAWFKSEIMFAGQRKFKSENVYAAAIKGRKGEKGENDKKRQEKRKERTPKGRSAKNA